MDNRSVMVVRGGGLVDNGLVGHFTVIYWGDCRVMVGGGRRLGGHVVGRTWAWHRVDKGRGGRGGGGMVNSLGHLHLLAMAVGGATDGDLDMTARECGDEAGEEGEEKSLQRRG